MIKLNTNENPYPPSPKVRAAIDSFDEDKLRLYPDPKAESLVKVLANYYDVNDENVFVGVGSDDVIAMAFLTFFNSDKPIMFPDITYSFYDVWADLYRIPYVTCPLADDFTINVDDYKNENGGVIIANPNAPTGELLPLDKIEEIVKANQDVVIIIDEAYVDFGGESAIPLTKKYDNVLVVQTFSKSRSMAGLRIGYAIGDATLIKYLNDVKYSFNSYTMDQTTLALGPVAVEDDDYFKETVGKIIKTREWSKKELKKLGFSFGDSKSNFIFATHKDKKAVDIFNALREKNIFVRYFNKPRIDNYLRITVGTDEEMEELFKFLREYLA